MAQFITVSIIDEFLEELHPNDYSVFFTYKHGSSDNLHISFDHEELRIRMSNGESMLYFHLTPFGRMIDVAFIGQSVDSMSTVGRSEFTEALGVSNHINFVASQFFNVRPE